MGHILPQGKPLTKRKGALTSRVERLKSLSLTPCLPLFLPHLDLVLKVYQLRRCASDDRLDGWRGRHGVSTSSRQSHSLCRVSGRANANTFVANCYCAPWGGVPSRISPCHNSEEVKDGKCRGTHHTSLIIPVIDINCQLTSFVLRRPIDSISLPAPETLPRPWSWSVLMAMVGSAKLGECSRKGESVAPAGENPVLRRGT